MAESEREVFAYFRRDSSSSAEVDALAYASFAFDKYEWAAKFEANTGQPPSQADVERWIRELPDSRLDEIQQIALDFFRQTVSTYVELARDAALREGAQDAVVLRVRQATSFWRNLPGNLAVGVASSFAFALLLILSALVFTHDPSPIALYNKYAAPPAPKPP